MWILIGITILVCIIMSRKQFEYNRNTEEKTIHIVISRYNEDLHWLKEEPFNKYKQIVYEKGEKTIPSSIVLANVGRESHTYLYHIIQNYHKLPDILIFLPGSAMDSTFNKRDKTMNVMRRIGMETLHENCGNNNFLQSMYNFEIDDYKSTNKSNSNMNPESKLQRASIRPFGKWFETKLPDKKSIPNVWYSGIFYVTKEQILRNPKVTYENLLQELSVGSSPETGHYMERAWAGLFCN